MGRYLTIRALIAILVIAVAPVRAQDMNWSVATSLNYTESTPQSGIFSHMDWVRPLPCGIGDPNYWLNPKKTDVIGTWFSTASVLPNLVKDGKNKYIAIGDLIGFELYKIQKVRLSPDGGVTQWVANLIPGKGWCVDAPMGTTTETLEVKQDQKGKGKEVTTVTTTVTRQNIGLEVGGFALQWGLEVKDQKNKTRFLFFAFTTTSVRKASAGQHIMVQASKVDIDRLNDIARQLYIREHGFQPATDEASPAVLAAQQMYQSKQPKEEVRHEETNRSSERRNDSDGTVRKEITGSSVKSKTVAPTEQVQVEMRLWPLNATKPVVWYAKVDKCWYDALREESQCVYLTRGGKRIAAGEAKVVDGRIEIQFASNVDIQQDDGIDTVEEVK